MTLSKNKGFTFIELMVVISIIAILLGAGIATYTSANKRSRDARRKSDLEQVRSALEMFRADNGSYPDAGCSTESCGVVNLTTLPLTPEYMPSIPIDPDGIKEYKYRPTNKGTGTTFYGYCLYGNVEQGTGYLTECDDTANYNYEVKNP